MKGNRAGNGRMMRLGFVITICIFHGTRNLNSIWFVVPSLRSLACLSICEMKKGGKGVKERQRSK